MYRVMASTVVVSLLVFVGVGGGGCSDDSGGGGTDATVDGGIEMDAHGEVDAGPPPEGVIAPTADLVYLGAFRLPDEESEETSWAYGGHGMSYNPDGDPSGPDDGFPGSLFSISHPYQNFVSEFTIPEPVISSNREDLPVATTLQPFTDVSGGRQTGGLTGTTLGDIQYLPAHAGQDEPLLYWVLFEYYMPDPEETSFGWSSVDFSNLETHGMWRLGDFPFSSTSKYLFEIPASFADAYTDGLTLAAGRYRIVNGGSWGPALYACAPWLDNGGAPPDDGASLRAIRLLFYPDRDHRLEGFAHSDDWKDGAWLQAGERWAVMLAGTKSVRNVENGLEYYGVPEPDGCGGKGYHAEPYLPMLLFYDPADLASVAQGQAEAYEPQPYSRLVVADFMFNYGCGRSKIGGVGYDRERNYLYVIERLGDPNASGYDPKPIVHVWQVTESDQGLDTEPPEQVVGLASDSVDATRVAFHWEAGQDDRHVAGYIISRFGEPFAYSSDTMFVDENVNPDATYLYSVTAIDSAGHLGDPSAALEVTTPQGTDDRICLFWGIEVTDVTATSARIVWNTDEPTTGVVEYEVQYSGNTQTATSADLAVHHEVLLEGLEPGQPYVFGITATDRFSNEHSYPHKGFHTMSQ